MGGFCLLVELHQKGSAPVSLSGDVLDHKPHGLDALGEVTVPFIKTKITIICSSIWS